VANTDDQDDEFLAIEIHDHAKVSHSVFPEGLQGTAESFSCLSRVGERRNPLAQEPQDADLDLLVEFGQFAFGPNRT